MQRRRRITKFTAARNTATVLKMDVLALCTATHKQTHTDKQHTHIGSTHVSRENAHVCALAGRGVCAAARASLATDRIDSGRNVAELGVPRVLLCVRRT